MSERLQGKWWLRDILPECSQLLFLDHVEERGEELFELICQRDLEGIVAKHRLSRYVVDSGNPAWAKIKNRRYSQCPDGISFSSASTRREALRNLAGTPVRRQLAVQHRGAPHRKRKTLPPLPTWTCPHCRHVHTAETLIRLGSETLQCAECRRAFAAVSDKLQNDRNKLP